MNELCDATKDRIGHVHQAAHDIAHDEAGRNADKHQPGNFVGMAQHVFGRHRTAEGMRQQVKWVRKAQPLDHQFEVIYEIFHIAGKIGGIIAQAMPAQIRRDDAHCLSKGLQLEFPLRGAATIAMHEHKRPLHPRLLRLHIDDADAPQPLVLPSKRHNQRAAVEFDVECHKVPPLGERADCFYAAAYSSQAKKTENIFSS